MGGYPVWYLLSYAELSRSIPSLRPRSSHARRLARAVISVGGSPREVGSPGSQEDVLPIGLQDPVRTFCLYNATTTVMHMRCTHLYGQPLTDERGSLRRR